MSRIQDHPIVSTVTVMGTVFGIASSLAQFGQISVDLAYWAGVLLIVSVIGAIIYSEWNAEPDFALEPVTPEPIPLPTVQGTTYTVDYHISLPTPHLAQEYYLEAFQALADGGYQQTVNGQAQNWPLGIEIGKVALNWVKDHYLQYTHAYPGARGEQTKRQLGELAFRRIKEGRLFSPEIAQIIIPLVDRHVSNRFSQDH